MITYTIDDKWIFFDGLPDISYNALKLLLDYDDITDESAAEIEAFAQRVCDALNAPSTEGMVQDFTDQRKRIEGERDAVLLRLRGIACCGRYASIGLHDKSCGNATGDNT